MGTRAWLVFGTALAIGASLAWGNFSISPVRVLAVLADRVGLQLAEFTAVDESVVWSIRMPRALLAAVVGGGLGVAGMSLQAVFRNPLGDAQILGISGTAAVGSVFAVAVFGIGGGFVSPLAGVAGAFAGIALVSTFARFQGRTEVATLILAGIALAAVAAAVVGLLVVIGERDELRSRAFWLLGSLGGATWRELWITSGFVAVGLSLLPSITTQLDLLLLGEREAAHMGVDVPAVRTRALASIAIVVGAAVAAAGIVGFVGLVAPHVVRRFEGARHGRLLWSTLAAGALFVVLADLTARTVAAPAEVQLGVLTALVGAPLFLWLLRRTRAAYGEWG